MYIMETRFQELLNESKKTYNFKIGVAGSLPEGCEESIKSCLKKYDVAFVESDSDDELRDKLAMFYAQRTLTKQPITPADQAEAAYLMVSGQLSKTTGQIISVDGGLHEAFLR